MFTQSEQRRINEPCQVRFGTRVCHSKKLALALLRRLAPIVVLLVVSIGGAQMPQPSQTGSGDFTLRMNADLVILSATVLDHHNAHVSGLSQDEFQVFEDGVPQQIKHFSHDDIPVTVGIVIDNSGSMTPKRNDVIDAALAFARSSNPQDQVFVVNFNEHVSLGLPPGIPFTDRPEQLQLALSGIKAAGQTALYDGIAVALDHIKKSSLEKKVLIVISDGGDNASKVAMSQVIEMAKQSTATIYAIGIFNEQDGDQNPAVLSRLAKDTGGVAFFPQSSKDVGSLCEEIAHDIRSQYTLTYIPASAMQGGKYRTIEVKAYAPHRGRLSVRTRAGYSMPVAIPISSNGGNRP